MQPNEYLYLGRSKVGKKERRTSHVFKIRDPMIKEVSRKEEERPLRKFPRIFFLLQEMGKGKSQD